jgi:hypothetical protein
MSPTHAADPTDHFAAGPLETTKDTPTKLERVTEIYQHVSAGGFKVIAGHAGAVNPALRALGIDAADAGLATAEAFDQSGSRRSAQSRTTDENDRQGGGPQSRMYFPTIDRSLDGKEGLFSLIRGCVMPGSGRGVAACSRPGRGGRGR